MRKTTHYTLVLFTTREDRLECPRRDRCSLVSMGVFFVSVQCWRLFSILWLPMKMLKEEEEELLDWNQSEESYFVDCHPLKWIVRHSSRDLRRYLRWLMEVLSWSASTWIVRWWLNWMRDEWSVLVCEQLLMNERIDCYSREEEWFSSTPIRPRRQMHLAENMISWQKSRRLNTTDFSGGWAPHASDCLRNRFSTSASWNWSAYSENLDSPTFSSSLSESFVQFEWTYRQKLRRAERYRRRRDPTSGRTASSCRYLTNDFCSAST